MTIHPQFAVKTEWCADLFRGDSIVKTRSGPSLRSLIFVSSFETLTPRYYLSEYEVNGHGEVRGRKSAHIVGMELPDQYDDGSPVPGQYQNEFNQTFNTQTV